jgi:hypothetical protein
MGRRGGRGRRRQKVQRDRQVRHPLRQQEGPTGQRVLVDHDAGYFFVDNPLNKYTVSPRNDLKYNPDGSLDLYIQNESPGKDKEANWLPAPKGAFILMMRLYYPRENPPILDGTWKAPPVRVVR